MAFLLRSCFSISLLIDIFESVTTTVDDLLAKNELRLLMVLVLGELPLLHAHELPVHQVGGVQISVTVWNLITLVHLEKISQLVHRYLPFF